MDEFPPFLRAWQLVVGQDAALILSAPGAVHELFFTTGWITILSRINWRHKWLTGIFPWHQIVSLQCLSIDPGKPEEEELQIYHPPQLSPECFNFSVQGFC